MVYLAFSLGQVHAGLLDHFLATALLPFNSHVVIGPHQQRQLEILSLLPLWHDEQVILARGKRGGEGDTLPITVPSLNPSVPIELPLDQHHPNPHILVI